MAQRGFLAPTPRSHSRPGSGEPDTEGNLFLDQTCENCVGAAEVWALVRLEQPTDDPRGSRCRRPGRSGGHEADARRNRNRRTVRNQVVLKWSTSLQAAIDFPNTRDQYVLDTSGQCFGVVIFAVTGQEGKVRVSMNRNSASRLIRLWRCRSYSLVVGPAQSSRGPVLNTRLRTIVLPPQTAAPSIPFVP